MATLLRIHHAVINLDLVTDIEERGGEIYVYFAAGADERARCRVFAFESAAVLRAWLDEHAPRAAQRGPAAVGVE